MIFILPLSVSSETKMTMACLGSLANLCRNNPVVQDYIKNMVCLHGITCFSTLKTCTV